MTSCLAACLALSAMPAAAQMAARAQRVPVAGIDLVTYHTDVKDVVVLIGALPAGDAFASAGNGTVPTLTGMMLDRGTSAQDQFAIARQLEDVGAEISYAVGPQSLQVRAKCLKKDLPLVLRILAEELRTPALTAAEFAKARQQLSGMLESSLQSTDVRSQEAFARAVFPPGNPNRPHTLEELLAAAKTATIDEVRAFHAAYYGPAHFTLVIVGDVAVSETEPLVGRVFAGWSGGQAYREGVAAADAASRGPGPAGGEIRIPLAEKTSVSFLLGEATDLRNRDPDGLALQVGTAILGDGFTSRLMSTVRDREGLTYGIGAIVFDDTLTPGAWQIEATFAPALLAKGVASARRELQHWWQDGVTEPELALRKQGLIGAYFVGLSTTTGLADRILLTIQRGYDLDRLDAYPRAVEALTVPAINSAIKAHLDPAKMLIVEAGSLSP
jgi:zinc protease